MTSNGKNPPIRVLHMIGNLDIGGSQAFVINLYRKIDREKIQFDFVIDRKERNFFVPEIEKMGGRVFVLPNFKGTNAHEVKKAWDNFFLEHKEYKILHSHVRSYAALFIPIAEKHGLKTIIHSHSTSNGKGFSSAVKKIMQYPLRHTADYLFGCSKEANEWLFGRKKACAENCFIIKNAIDAKEYSFSQAEREKYREELGIENKTAYIHVGRLHKSKNHIFLLCVFCEILKKNKNSVLLLVGDGEEKENIILKIKELDIENNIIYLGSRSDIPQLLSAADCFLFPSLWEGLGISAIEAQAASLPTLCSESIPGEVKITELCRFLPIDNSDETVHLWASEAIKAAEENSLRVDRYGEVSKAGFDISNNAERITEFYLCLK